VLYNSYVNWCDLDFKKIGEQEIATFQQNCSRIAANFQQRRLWALTISILHINFPQMEFFSFKFCIYGRKFLTIFQRPKIFTAQPLLSVPSCHDATGNKWKLEPCYNIVHAKLDFREAAYSRVPTGFFIAKFPDFSSHGMTIFLTLSKQ